jgi:Cd2+/Zn2+-exporting ATPase
VATVLCAVFGLAAHAIGPGDGSIALFALSYLAGGAIAAITAAAELSKLRLTVDLLMILAAVGAAALGDWGEGAVLLFLFSLSNTLEAYAMYRTTRSIDALIRLRPREACRELARPLRRGSAARVHICVHRCLVLTSGRLR